MNSLPTLTIALLLASALAHAQAWIQIDANNARPSPASGWNTIAGPADHPTLLDIDGGATTVSVAFSAGWQDSSSTADQQGAFIDTPMAVAASDYFFIRQSSGGFTNATVTLSGLSDSVPYAVQLASSINGAEATKQRRADYKVNGAFSSAIPSGQAFNAYSDGFQKGLVMTWPEVYATGGTVVVSVTSLPLSSEDTATINAIRIGSSSLLPAAPVLTQAQAVSDTEAELAWSGTYPEGTSFQILCNDGTQNIGPVATTAYQHFLTGLRPGTTYSVYLWATTSAGSGATSPPGTITTPAAPEASQVYQIDFNGEGTAPAGWTVLGAPVDQTAGGLQFTFQNFGDSSSSPHTGQYSTTVFAQSAFDYFFVQTAVNSAKTGTVAIAGLPDRAYRVQIAASSSTYPADRIADYRVNGEFSTLEPTGEAFNSNLEGYKAGRVLTWLSQRPVDGVLTLTVVPGVGSQSYYGMLNAVRLVMLPEQNGTVITVW